MAKKKTTPSAKKRSKRPIKKTPSGKSREVDLEKLSQQEASWLISKPSHWLRDHSHLPGRSADGTYHGQTLVRSLRGQFEAAELDAGECEAARQIGERVAEFGGSLKGLIRIFTEIRDRHGAAGMAALSELFLQECVAMQEFVGDSYNSPKTIESIQREAARQIEELADQTMTDDMRIIYTCPECGRYRWGKGWEDKPYPTGYAVFTGEECDVQECLAALDRENKNYDIAFRKILSEKSRLDRLTLEEDEFGGEDDGYGKI